MASSSLKKKGNLFEQMQFFMRPCMTKARYRKLIEENGGSFAHKMKNGVIRLTDNKEESHGIYTGFIEDSIKRGKLESIDDYDLEKAKKLGHIVTVAKSSLEKARRAYQPEEDEAITKYVLQHQTEYGEEGSAGGNALWREMERQQITCHTWQSMKNRYTRYLCHHPPAFPFQPLTLRSYGNKVINYARTIESPVCGIGAMAESERPVPQTDSDDKESQSAVDTGKENDGKKRKKMFAPHTQELFSDSPVLLKKKCAVGNTRKAVMKSACVSGDDSSGTNEDAVQRRKSARLNPNSCEASQQGDSNLYTERKSTTSRELRSSQSSVDENRSSVSDCDEDGKTSDEDNCKKMSSSSKHTHGESEKENRQSNVQEEHMQHDGTRHGHEEFILVESQSQTVEVNDDDAISLIAESQSLFATQEQDKKVHETGQEQEPILIESQSQIVKDDTHVVILIDSQSQNIDFEKRTLKVVVEKQSINQNQEDEPDANKTNDANETNGDASQNISQFSSGKSMDSFQSYVSIEEKRDETPLDCLSSSFTSSEKSFDSPESNMLLRPSHTSTVAKNTNTDDASTNGSYHENKTSPTKNSGKNHLKNSFSELQISENGTNSSKTNKPFEKWDFLRPPTDDVSDEGSGDEFDKSLLRAAVSKNHFTTATVRTKDTGNSQVERNSYFDELQLLGPCTCSSRSSRNMVNIGSILEELHAKIDEFPDDHEIWKELKAECQFF